MLGGCGRRQVRRAEAPSIIHEGPVVRSLHGWPSSEKALKPEPGGEGASGGDQRDPREWA